MSNHCKILLIGQPFHGKSTFGNFLKEALGEAQAFSTSSYLVYRLSLMEGIPVNEIIAHKEQYRPKLIALGNAMCGADPACLVGICLWACQARFALIDGIRRMSEFNASRAWFDEIIWVERTDAPPSKERVEMNQEHATLVIHNQGNLEKLQQDAIQLAESLKQRF